MKITIDHLTEGASKAEGAAVIIDVFRAYTVESCAFSRGIKRIYPVADIEMAYELKKENPSFLLAGERHMKKPEGFDFGNSPSEINNAQLDGREMIHTTSAGTQGIRAAVKADTIFLAALVNARATAEYIKKMGFERVSLVCMGYENTRPTDEDTFCAEYIKAILEGKDNLFDKEKAVAVLKNGDGKRFFIPENQSFAPQSDFFLCTQFDVFPFAIKVVKDDLGRDISVKKDI